MSERYICIHGHFYQPPRENAWLEAIETQDSAHPYHDWNQRISAECYAANAASRILDAEGRIIQIVNNYSKMSFNFGPTLLAWMEAHAPDVYRAVLEADAQSRQQFSGHGSAIAQAYNHMILPLAHPRDKYTQVCWGIEDFKHRFGRKPEGMWLPETAVDLESLDMMAEQGVRFTILSPYQAARVRLIGKEKWKNVNAGTIDPTMPYMVRLPSGRSQAIFFYDGPISHAVAFEQILKSGEAFTNRLMGGFAGHRRRAQLVHIATDGETYGHHQPFGDMGLAYALNYIESNALARLTNYSEYLEKYPPTYEVEILENTSWSCAHGVARWYRDCGCNTGRQPGWNQAWRQPLRNALDGLRDGLAPAFEDKMGRYLKNPWGARNDYIQIVLDRSPQNFERFLGSHALRELSAVERIDVLKLLEMQRQVMLMYTSCGWFFDELSGLETVQVIQYAGRAIQLFNEVFGSNLEPGFLEQMQQAKSNIGEHGDGRRIYEKFVKPAMVDLKKVAAHYAISSLFEEYPEQTPIFCFIADRQDYQHAEAGKAKLALGRAAVTSAITRESCVFQFGVLHFGDHNITCGVLEALEENRYQGLQQEIFGVFDKVDFPEVLRVLDTSFGDSMYSIKSLFRDEQRKILDILLEATLADAVSVYRHLYEDHVPLMRFVKDSANPVPKALYLAGEFVVNYDLRELFSRDELDYDAIKIRLEDADLTGITLHADTLEYTLRKNLEHMAEVFYAAPNQLDLLENLTAGIELVYALPFDVNLRKIQTLYFNLRQARWPELKAEAEKGGPGAGRRIELFDALSEKLFIRFQSS
jgi:alpha-amylase/alpha-mannosidase (GH57 family)